MSLESALIIGAKSYGLNCTVTKSSNFRLSVLYLDYIIHRDGRYRSESNVYHKTLKLQLMNNSHHQPCISFLVLLQTIYYTPSGLKLHKFIGSQFWTELSLKMGLSGAKIKVLAGIFLFWKIWGRICPLCSPASR